LRINEVVGYSDVKRIIDGCANKWYNETPRQDQFNSMMMMIQRENFKWMMKAVNVLLDFSTTNQNNRR